MLAQQGLHLRPVAGRWNDDATRTLQRLSKKSGDGVSAFAQDQRLEFAHDTVRESRLGFPRLGIVVIAGAGGAQHAFADGQVKVRMVAGQPGQAG